MNTNTEEYTNLMVYFLAKSGQSFDAIALSRGESIIKIQARVARGKAIIERESNRDPHFEGKMHMAFVKGMHNAKGGKK